MHPWITFIWILSLLTLMYLYTSRRSTRSLCYTSTTPKAMKANRGWKACDYGKKYIEGTLLETQPPQNKKHYKSCRRRCIEANGCNYWSFVTKKNANVALRGTCYLYSTIDTSLTKNDSGRISGDLSCNSAQTLKSALRPNPVSLS